jgi:hypothetical protein
MRRSNKDRITITVAHDVLKAINRAVAAGAADSVSAWLSGAAAERIAKERRKQAWTEALALYESEQGTITEDQLAAAEKELRRRTISVRPKRRKTGTG